MQGTLNSVRGEVCDEAGRPLQGADAVLIGRSDLLMTTTSDSGVFKFLGLPNGVYTLFVAKPGWLVHSMPGLACNGGRNIAFAGMVLLKDRPGA